MLQALDLVHSFYYLIYTKRIENDIVVLDVMHKRILFCYNI